MAFLSLTPDWKCNELTWPYSDVSHKLNILPYVLKGHFFVVSQLKSFPKNTWDFFRNCSLVPGSIQAHFTNHTYLCQLSPSPSLWNGKYITFLIRNAYYIFGDNFRFPFYFSCWRISHLLRCLEIPSRIFHLPFTTWPWGVIKGRWELNAGWWLFNRK